MRLPQSPPGPSLGFRLIGRSFDLATRLLGWRVRTRGIRHIPVDGSAVITWNHHSYLDMAVTGSEIHRLLDRPVRILGSCRFFSWPVLGWMLRRVDAIPVGGGGDALAAAVAALRAGHLVLIAPEGRVSPSLEVTAFRTGAARMAHRAGVPVVPSASWGTQRASSPHRVLAPAGLWRLPVEVAFGPPVPPGPDVGATTAAVRRATVRLLDAAQRRYPEPAPHGAVWAPQRLGGGAPPPTVEALLPADLADGDDRVDGPTHEGRRFPWRPHERPA